MLFLNFTTFRIGGFQKETPSSAFKTSSMERLVTLVKISEEVYLHDLFESSRLHESYKKAA